MTRFQLLTLILLTASCQSRHNTDKQEKTDSPTDYSFTVKDGRLLNIKTGDHFDSVLTQLSEFKIVKDSFVGCEGCDRSEPIFRVFEKGHLDPIISIEHGWYAPEHGYYNQDTLLRVRTSDQRFKTDKGIGVNMTIKDLKNLYEIEDVSADYETGLHVIVKGFKGSFGISTIPSTNWISYNKENIPDTLVIDEIIVL